MQAFERMRSLSIDMMDHLISVNEASDSGIFRQTVVIVTIFFLYIVLGMLLYHIMLGWDFIDSLYFVTITFSTVGYGDLDPKTPAERMFTSFYLLVGLIALASILSVHLALLAEHQDALEAERNRRTAAKITEHVETSSAISLFAKAARRVSKSISDAAGQLKRTFSTSSFGFGGGSSGSNSNNPSVDGNVDAGKMSDVKRLQREILDHANNPVLDDTFDDKPQLIRVHSSTGGVFSTTAPVTSRSSQAAAKNAAAEAQALHESAMRDGVASSREAPAAARASGGGSDVRDSFTASMRVEAEFGSSGPGKILGKMNVNKIDGGMGGAATVIDPSPARASFSVGAAAHGLGAATGRSESIDSVRGAAEGPHSMAYAMGGRDESLKSRQIETMGQIMMDQWDQDLASLRGGAIFNFFVIAVIVMIGVLAMMQIEGWDFNLSFYWACQTVTTVGYGDTPPNSKAGKIFTVFYIIFGLAWVGKAIGDIVKYPLMLRKRHVEEKVLKQFGGDLSDEKLKMIFHSDMYARNPSLRRSAGEMTKMEFIILVLEIMNKVNEKDILLASKIFDRLDVNGDGSLNQDDMKMIRAAAQVRDTEQLKQESRRRTEEARIREQQQEDAAKRGLTGHLYEVLSGFGLVDNSLSGPLKSSANSLGSSRLDSKGETLLLVSSARAGSDSEDEEDLTRPLALNAHP